MPFVRKFEPRQRL